MDGLMSPSIFWFSEGNQIKLDLSVLAGLCYECSPLIGRFLIVICIATVYFWRLFLFPLLELLSFSQVLNDLGAFSFIRVKKNYW